MASVEELTTQVKESTEDKNQGLATNAICHAPGQAY
jgi:hypothetical protein